MVAHLTLDLPYSLVAIDSTEDHKDDYLMLGELMIAIAPDFIDDLRYYYDTDAEDVLNGFFLGDWVDGAFGEDTTITLNYQTIRTKSWNNFCNVFPDITTKKALCCMLFKAHFAQCDNIGIENLMDHIRHIIETTSHHTHVASDDNANSSSNNESTNYNSTR